MNRTMHEVNVPLVSRDEPTYVTATLKIPVDLTSAEAEKLIAVLQALKNEPR